MISETNMQGKTLQVIPYFAGISGSLFFGLVSIPLCFDRSTVLWFNQDYVTMELPEMHEISSVWEIGGFAWNWMEPPLGLASFVLLSLQFARAQMENLGIRPYTGFMKGRRAERLVGKFPQYCPNILRDFSHAQPML
jgi:hypothetical protein